MSKLYYSIFLALLLFLVTLFPASVVAKTINDFLSMDLEQLMQVDVTVTSPGKHPQKLHEAASAIYVVTQEDIRRTGAINIMEALRIVPGLTVSRINESQYAISVRGFNRLYGSNKLLVLMDGRTIYSPSFSGVDWTKQDTAMEDIDRIEVIRGPGAALWGSNAVAGVINIITKSSKDTQGALVSAARGTEENGIGTVRYGGQATENLTYRVYGKYRDVGPGKRNDGSDAYDQKWMSQGGFRSDWQAGAKDLVTFQGDYYVADAQSETYERFASFTPSRIPLRWTNTHSGNNLISRWNRTLENDSSFTIQAWYDQVKYQSDSYSTDTTINQGDLEAQYNFRIGEIQRMSVGASYRYADFYSARSFDLRYPNQSTNLFGFFIQDEIALAPKIWSLILGSKFEHNKFTGLEIQPNIRTAWTPAAEHTLWAAVSRAVRLPNPGEDNLNYDAVGSIDSRTRLPILIRILGNRDIGIEKLVAYEMGYRVNVMPTLSFELTGFLNQYDDLVERTLKDPFLDTTTHEFPSLVVPMVFENAMKGETYGIELNSEWKPFKSWRILGGYTWLRVDLREKMAGIIPGALDTEKDPRHLFNIRSYLDLPNNFEFDTMLYYTSANKNQDLLPYARLDLRLGWKPMKKIELSLTGQNLLQGRHAEFSDFSLLRSEIPRAILAKTTFRF